MKSSIATCAALAFLISLSLLMPARADGPATQPAAPPAAKADAPADDQDFVISQMRVQELKGMTFLFVSSQTTLGQIGDQIRQSMEKIEPAIKAGQVKPVGPSLIIYHGVNGDPNTQFPLEVGFPVAPDTTAPDGFEVKKLDTFRCATVLFSGSMQNIRHAYEAVYNDLQGAGLEPTEEGREAILLFEGPDSVNNVALIEVGVK
jgi:predicted transcriptional regulator YdeE